MWPAGAPTYRRGMTGFQLDAGARLALDVALGTAGACGDDRCGTADLLFGIVAPAEADRAELLALFALDSLRVERAVGTVRGVEPVERGRVFRDPPLTPRAQIALDSPSRSGSERRTVFDVLAVSLQDPRSGAATVLRRLGVKVGEVRRLAELGASDLARAEVDDLIQALDRRGERHLAWWGPSIDGTVARVGLPNDRALVVARSETAVASIENVVAGPDGFGFSLNLVSCGDWMLSPVWAPPEDLVPGLGVSHRLDPDVVTCDLRFSDGTLLSNRYPSSRWRSDPPERGALVPLGTRSVVDDRNDRRLPARRSDTAEWWVWPLPPPGEVTFVIEWRSEALRGSAALDTEAITRPATALRHRT